MSASGPSWTAEDAAADWMRRHGFRDATVMNGGVDTGVHVIASRAVAQVRTSLTPVGPEALSRLVRYSRGMPGCHRILFSLSGYSEAARNYAEEHGIALLVVGRNGSVVPANAWGENLSGSRFGGGPLAMRPQAPAALAAPMAPARGSGWKHPVTWSRHRGVLPGGGDCRGVEHIQGRGCRRNNRRHAVLRHPGVGVVPIRAGAGATAAVTRPSGRPRSSGVRARPRPRG